MTTIEQSKANKTDAGNGSKAICRVSNASRSPSPDPSRSPSSMRKRPFIFGILTGIVLCGLVGVILALRSAFDSTDPRYEMVAVSWGSHTNNSDLWIYQVQVSATQSAKKGILDVSARVCIGSGNYFHDLGTIGTASDFGDASKRFGTITWSPDGVTIAGTDGVKATLLRSELQKHR